MRYLAFTCLFVLLLMFSGASATQRAAGESAMEKKAAKLLEAWQDRFNGESLNALVAGPYVIAGDGSPQRLAQYRDRTILAADRALHATYFKKRPKEPILILLFENRKTYERCAKNWFDDDTVPHFGFYRRHDNVMLMNISTGRGTLVHEMVHALIAPDFPAVPDWFNEGLASLYEQCSIDADTIQGHVNWRLPALQKAIRAKKLRPLKELVGDPRFYDEKNVGLNYAQARYLLMCLQEKGKLTEFYKQFRDNAKKDPTGLKTLTQLVGPQNLDDFEAEWRAWTLSLRFDRSLEASPPRA